LPIRTFESEGLARIILRAFRSIVVPVIRKLVLAIHYFIPQDAFGILLAEIVCGRKFAGACNRSPFLAGRTVVGR
jgi:hypothetical protein